MGQKKKKLMLNDRDMAPDMYWPLYEAIAPHLKAAHRFEILAEENLPEPSGGGAIVAAIHNGPLDAAFISLAAGERGRAVRWIADKGACEAPVIGPAIRSIGAIPVASVKGRSSDPAQVREAIHTAADTINDGYVVGIFPEGRIRPFFKSHEAFTFKTGAIRLAIETGAPIIPAWARGAGAVFPWLAPVQIKDINLYFAIPIWLPAKIRVVFGPPFNVDPALSLSSPREDIKAECKRLQAAISNMQKRYAPALSAV